jgi:molybdenum cofactor cytidylyltransferase
MIDAAKVAVLLLAAGKSERFGADKLLACIDGVPIAMHAARRLASLGSGWRIAVCRDESPLIAELSGLGFQIIVNREPERGLSSSLALGAERAQFLGAHGLLVGLADMPFVGRDHFEKLLSAFDDIVRPVVASDALGIAMPPAIFGAAYFSGLQELRGDQGARHILADAYRVAADPRELADIDRPDDLP